MMSFTVARRHGDRYSRGVAPLHAAFSSASSHAQRASDAGVVVGTLLAAAVFKSFDFSLGRATTLVLIVAAFIVIVGMLAALGPARRSLRIQPADVLKADA
jgi:hypothetical protein